MEAGQKVSLDFSAATKLKDMLPHAGFTNINIKWQHWPVGPWAKGAKQKQIGAWCLEDMQDVVRNTGALFTRVLGWKKEEFDVYAAKTTEEMRSRRRHMWVEM